VQPVLQEDEFDLLAACLHPITGRWEFKFHPTRTLQVHSTCAGRLSQNVHVENGDWVASAKEALDELTA
jgi:hypothetical protein